MFDKIQLPYAFDALEPYIDAETVETHYSKHLQKYVDNLNSLIKGYEQYTEGKSLDQLLANVNELPEEIRQGVIDQGGGVSNHNLYFALLSPTPKKAPEGKLLDEIHNTFGDLDTLKTEVSNAAIGQFGSGYGFLVKDKDGKLSVRNTLNQNSPAMNGVVPILTIDVWEHAYYLKYKNLRADYVKNIWNLIDWEKVEGLYLNYTI
ncbi:MULTISPECIES: superoxide dismutase [Clostridium]|jgi:Superoxide dismutase|uniref:Superoxide dismutase n=2 Tax=Clostridium beijerinckii TaxID=1520 RepID=A0A0B5QK87_CLOBE|nr:MULTISPECIES: superoxide dismutase [Clostridium]ABR33683.1 Superoxide dismutase [Clostridium beijerinckii NCIMB 8052]AIU02757.1 superoxide dismutase [Clostridium beijerinckii ATCC 35702]AJG98322.1 superoxide dismutase [Clostridium beijerinckii]ALB47209.1 superoxide dismutase [Clostridium beijerinckii NRRL B-598]MBF7812102.1 superoxide dismutase [Clostridium beijerinckii]